MRQRGFLFDPNRCLGCKACQMACAVNHSLPAGVFLRKVQEVEFSQDGQIMKYYLSLSCNHCINPECFRLCPERAYRKRRDGTVLFNKTLCKGCGTCTRGCPFEAPVVNPVDGKIIKCDLCYDSLDAGESPFCISSCPVQALKLVELNGTNEITQSVVKTLPGFSGIQITQPAVRFVRVLKGKQVLRNRPIKKGTE